MGLEVSEQNKSKINDDESETDDALRNTEAMPEESMQSSQGIVSAGPLLIFLGLQSPEILEFWPELRELLLRIS